MRQDIHWFIHFLPKFNDRAILVKSPIQESHTIHIGASLTGLGGVWGNKIYATPIYPIPDFKMEIVHWEMLNILLALRVWGNRGMHSIVKFHCANLAKTKDPFLAACIRNIWMITAISDIDIQIDHTKGVYNIIVDLLSRLYSDRTFDQQLLQNLRENYQWFKIPLSYFHIDTSI